MVLKIKYAPVLKVLTGVPGSLAPISVTVPSTPAGESEHGEDRSQHRYLAEDDGLPNGDATVDVAQGLVLVFPTLAQHVILSDVVQGQLLFS